MSETALQFMKRCDGRIVSSGDLGIHQIAEAQACRRFWVDEETGLGWAIVPWSVSTQKDRERETELAAKRAERLRDQKEAEHGRGYDVLRNGDIKEDK